MDLTLFSLRLVMTGLFFISGFNKFSDQAGFRQALVDFGAPGWAVIPGAVAIPLAELLVAAALLSGFQARWAALVGMALLILFTLAITYQLAQGRQPACHCFGKIDHEPVSWKTLVRNGILIAAMGLVFWKGWALPSLFSYLSQAGLTVIQWVGIVIFIAAIAVIALEGWFIFELLQQQGRLLLRIDALERRIDQVAQPQASSQPPLQPARLEWHGLPAGSRAPAFTLKNITGKPLAIETLFDGKKPLLILFVEAGCQACLALLPDIKRWQDNHDTAFNLLPVGHGAQKELIKLAKEHRLKDLLIDENEQVFRSYQAVGTPTGVLVNGDGSIGSMLAEGEGAIRNLVNRLSVKPELPGSKSLNSLVGKRVHSIRLPDLSGKSIDLAKLGGRATVLLFWNPDCGYCQQMLASVKAWERERPEQSPELILISAGTAEANRNHGLGSTILLDPVFESGNQFGIRGTPSAVLINQHGRIASEVAAGSGQVLALIQNGMQALPLGAMADERAAV